MRFTFRQIEYFIAAAESGSIKLASERINISQPSISTAISQLERELGAQLFLRRHAQGLSLTPVGRQVLAEAKLLLDKANRLYETASEATETVRGTLALGCLVTLAPMILPEVSQKFTARYPGTQVLPGVADQETLLNRLESAELDVALGYDLMVPDEFEFEPLAELPPYAMVAQSHALADRPSVSLEDLSGHGLILLDLPLSRDYFMGLFAREGLTPRIVARIPHADVIRTLVANDFGYAIANVRPRSTRAMDGHDVSLLRIEGDPQPMRIGLLRIARRQPTRLVSTFRAHCRALFADDHVPGMDAPPPMA
ncbi:LysR family transcriptional regulator [Sagittula stellata]|nr:LysR family transcriptional regulator [Sagittula stellata]